ncbi:MAG: helix-turn-helix transcriptional regulator [Monoglobaceae bacterium]
MKIIPQIVNLGLYDAALVHGNVTSTKPRRVSIYEIEFITEDGGFSYIGNQRFPIRKGGVICAKPGQFRHTDLPYKCMYIHAVIEDDELSSLLRSAPDFYHPSAPDAFEAAFRALISEARLPKYSTDIDITIKFLEILSLIFKTSHPSPLETPSFHKNMKIIQKAISFIDENYTQNITLDDIAAHVHLSRIYFHKLFLDATGQTPHSYLLSKRISAVKFLLTATDKSFSDIAADCGFSSQSYMTYVFKREMSCTPMQYKKHLNNLSQT